MNIYEKLLAIQAELKAPKNQFNKFGGYNYRSCEDILEAVKPLCNAHKCVLVLTDKVVNIGDRYYVEATAALYDAEESGSAKNTAYARESESKKGMDESQITGTASSYARKYALNGLFCIDDTKDADTNEYKRNIDGRAANGTPTGAPEPPKRIVCCKCGAEIKAAQNGFQTLSAVQIANQTGGHCLKCFKGLQGK